MFELPLRAPSRGCVIVLLALAGLSTPALAQDWRPSTKQVDRSVDRPAPLFPDRYRAGPLAPVPLPRTQVMLPRLTVAESEPNDSLSLAQTIVLGDTVTGVIDPSGDVDYFAVAIDSGTIIDLDVDASQFGSALDPVIALFDPNSTDANFIVLAVNDDSDGLDSRIIYPIDATGTYFVGIVDFSLGGSPAHTYTFKFSTTQLTEQEPNDSPGEANLVALGDTITGVVNPVGDSDYYAFDVAAGTLVSISPSGGVFFPSMRFYATDGITELTNNDFSFDIEYFVAVAGQYFLEIRDFGGGGDPSSIYTVQLGTLQIGPGDPTTLFASGIGGPWGMAAGTSGDLFVVDVFDDRVVRVDVSGNVSALASNLGGASDLVVDGFGDLLVPGFDNTAGQPVIWRITTAGQQSVFYSGMFGTTITVGPTGDVWVSDGFQYIVRFDPLGDIKDSISTGGVPVFDLAFSPAGALHYTAFDTVYKIVNGIPQVVVTTDPFIEGIAFDRDGYLYVANGFEGKVLLFDPAYQLVEDPLARTNLGGPINLVFGRDTDGTTTARLFAANFGFGLNPPFAGGLVEMNPTGIRAPGWRVGIDLLRIQPAELTAGTVGAEYSETLSAEAAPAAVAWSVLSGLLPPGVELGAARGVISGIPEDQGEFAFTVKAESGDRFGFGNFVIVVSNPEVTVSAAADAILGVPGALTPELERFLDLQGNGNGFYDIGDFRAHLQAGGQLP